MFWRMNYMYDNSRYLQRLNSREGRGRRSKTVRIMYKKRLCKSFVQQSSTIITGRFWKFRPVTVNQTLCMVIYTYEPEKRFGTQKLEFETRVLKLRAEIFRWRNRNGNLSYSFTYESYNFFFRNFKYHTRLFI